MLRYKCHRWVSRKRKTWLRSSTRGNNLFPSKKVSSIIRYRIVLRIVFFFLVTPSLSSYEMQSFPPYYLLVEPEGAFLPYAKSGLGQMFDPLELRENEFTGPMSDHLLRLAGRRRHGHRRLPVRRRHISHARLRIILSGNRKRDLRSGWHFSYSRWVWHFCRIMCSALVPRAFSLSLSLLLPLFREVRSKHLKRVPCTLRSLSRMILSRRSILELGPLVLPGIHVESLSHEGTIVRCSQRTNTRRKHLVPWVAFVSAREIIRWSLHRL